MRTMLVREPAGIITPFGVTTPAGHDGRPAEPAARVLAERLLAGLPDRWRHTMGVARRARELSVVVEPAERDLLVAAAWLHDIGYGNEARKTGFHPLDGAAYLTRHGWPRRMAGLVAHHSAAGLVADAEGHGQALRAYPEERSRVADALTYADQTTGPVGQRLPIRARIAEMLARHGPDSAQARVHPVRERRLLAAAERVERSLRELPTDSAGAGDRLNAD